MPMPIVPLGALEHNRIPKHPVTGDRLHFTVAGLLYSALAGLTILALLSLLSTVFVGG